MKITVLTIVLTITLFAGCLKTVAQTAKPNYAPPSAAEQEAVKLSVETVKLFQQKKFDEALPLAQKVLEIRLREAGKNDISVAKAWNNVGYIQQRRGKTNEARNAFENAFDIYEAKPTLDAAEEKEFAELLDIAATYQANDGKLEKSAKNLLRSFELRRKIYGEDALETGDSLLKLAQVHQLSGDYDQAAPFFRRALDIRWAKLGKTSDETRDVFDKTICALTKLGDIAQADQMREKLYPPKTSDAAPDGVRLAAIIQGGVINGKALVLAKPPYPAEARAKRAKGTVSVQVTIDEAGNVIFACALNGTRELHRASETAAYQSKFAPTLLKGEVVRVSGVIVYNFVP